MRLPSDGSSDRRTACVLSSSNKVVTVFTAVALTADDVRSDACLAMISRERGERGRKYVYKTLATNVEGRRKQYHTLKVKPTYDSAAFEYPWPE